MRFLTTAQKSWMVRAKIKAGDFYPFPPSGFNVYATPDYENGTYMDTNIFTKSLTGQYFLVNKIENGFCRGNFYDRPKGADMWITEEELSRRPMFVALFIFLICFLPLWIYNLCRGGVKKIEGSLMEIKPLEFSEKEREELLKRVELHDHLEDQMMSTVGIPKELLDNQQTKPLNK